MLVDANVLSFVEDNDQDIWNGTILWWFYVPGVISTLALIMYAHHSPLFSVFPPPLSPPWESELNNPIFL